MENIGELIEVAPRIWSEIDLGEPYNWPPRGAARIVDALAEIAPIDVVEEVFANSDRGILNLKLRELVRPYLIGKDRELANAVGIWIISEWGGIRKGSSAVHQWIEELGQFDDIDVHRFIARQGKVRIASWSKLLAFADHKKQAIYDARTAVALNCALARLGSKRRFFMPASRNRIISSARKSLSESEGEKLGYLDYLELLSAFESQFCSESKLSAEMVIFANAPIAARRFLKGFG